MRLVSFFAQRALALSAVLWGLAAQAQQPAAFPQGRTVAAEARKIAALVGNAPADVKPAAQELLKAVTEQSKVIGDGIRALSMKFDVAARTSLTEAQSKLSPPMLAQRLAIPGDTNGDALGTYIEQSVQAAILHVTQALNAAKEEATKFTGAVEGALATAKSQAEALQTRGAPLVEQVTAFIASAKRQAARVLAASRARAQAIIAQIAQTGKQALATTAGPPRGYIQRIRGAAERGQQAVAAMATALPAGPGKELATQAQERLGEVGKTFAAAIRQARAPSRQAAAQIITDAYKALDADALAALFKEKGAQSAPDMEQKVNEIVQAATTSAKQTVAAARDAAKQAIDAAILVLSPLEAEASKLGPQSQVFAGHLRQVVMALRLEATRFVMRSSQGGRDSIRRAAQAAREAIAKAVGKEPPQSTGRAVAVEALTKLAEQLPPAYREAALAAVSVTRDAAREAKDISRKAMRAGAMLLSRAVQDATGIAASVQGVAKDPKLAATQLRGRIEAALRNTTTQYLAPLREARAKAKEIVALAENALRKIQTVTQRLGNVGSALYQQARRVANSSRREAALLVRSVRALTKAATRKLTESVNKVFGDATGVAPATSVSKSLLKAFQDALAKAPSAVRVNGTLVEAMMSKQRAAMKAAASRDAKALRQARKLARNATNTSIDTLMRDIKSPASKAKPQLLNESVTKMMQQARATVLAMVTQAKKNATAASLALKNEAARVVGMLSARDAATSTLASIARQYYDELRTRTARQLLLTQERGKEAVRKVVTGARAKLGGSIPGGVKKRPETLTLVRALAKVIRSAPAAVKNAVSGPLQRAVALAKQLSEGIVAIGTKTETALKKAEGALAKKPAMPFAAALKTLADEVRATVTDAKTRGTQLSEGADKLAKDADEAAEKSEDAAMKAATEGMKNLANALKRDAVRLMVTAKANAINAVTRFGAIAKAGPSAPSKTPATAPATPTKKAVPGKKAAAPRASDVLVAEVLR